MWEVQAPKAQGPMQLHRLAWLVQDLSHLYHSAQVALKEVC